MIKDWGGDLKNVQKYIPPILSIFEYFHKEKKSGRSLEKILT